MNRPAFDRAIQVDNVNNRRAFVEPMPRRLQGIFKVNCFLIHFALEQTYTTAVFKIDRRNNDHELIRRDEAAEVRKNPQADFLTLLGMKLAGKKRISSDAGNKWAAIFGVSSYHRSVFGNDIE